MNGILLQAFVNYLQEFKKNGYKFSNGRTLRAGTQQEAVRGYIDGLIQKLIHGHFEIPTGVGKTAIFISLIYNFLEAAKKIDPDQRVLVVVPSTDLVIQTARAFAKFMPEVAKTIEADDDEGHVIDWENSEIGAQYGKLKHAPNKPKILITTYQSLAKDDSDIVYPPSEYGFVIYDEGHFITGDKFSGSTQKFSNSLQLAVTATTEYSKDKNVQMYLKHEYYRLPIKVAIDRGDLCNVTPILVQTDFSLDQKKFDEFMVANNGRPLTVKQKEALFNQAARNEAIIDTYLLGKDPETGETYFGQTGLVFAAGVKHCADLKEQLTERINEEKYQPLKQWLESEGIELIAEIHGKTKGCELTIDGVREFYTKDQIKELHRKGKILLLVSDQELKQGTDFPADAVIMDAVDRYSWVDTKQRYGRGYRLNPEEPEKSCKVINFIDKNTLEVYGETPECLPIYCAETLEDVQFKKTPGRGAFKRFKTKPPMLDEALAKSGFELITDIERVVKISATYKKIREDSIHPPKTEEWMAKSEYVRFLNTAPTNEKFVNFWDKAANGQIKWEPALQCGKFDSLTRTTFCININEASRIRQHLGFSEVVSSGPITDDLVQLSDAQTLWGNKMKDKRLLSQFWEDAQKGLIKWEPALKAGYYTTRNFLINYCIHKDEAARVKAHLGIKDMQIAGTISNEWLYQLQTASKLGICVENQGFIDLWEQIEFGDPGFNPPLKTGYFKSGTRKPFCVHISEIDRIREKLGIAKPVGEKTDEWLSTKEFATALKVSDQSQKFTSFMEAAAGNTLNFNPPLRCGYFKGNGPIVFCINVSEVERVRKHLGVKDINVLGDKPDNFIGRKILAERINTATHKGKFAELWDKLEAGELALDPPLKAGFYKAFYVVAFYIHEDEIPRIKEILGMKDQVIVGDKTDEWLNKTHFASSMNMTIKKGAFQIFWEEAESGKLDIKPALKCGIFKSGGHRSFHIHESESARCKAYINERFEPSTLVSAANLVPLKSKKADKGMAKAS